MAALRRAVRQVAVRHCKHACSQHTEYHVACMARAAAVAHQTRSGGAPCASASQARQRARRAQAAGSAWAWPFQDAMGIALMLLILRQFQLPSIKARAVPPPACVSSRLP
jgi:hypothetical protein